MTGASSARSRPISERSCPGADFSTQSMMPSRSVSAMVTAAGAAYLGASPSSRLHST